MERWRRFLIVIIGFFENLVFAGCIFGWPALVHILQQENIYSHLCDGSPTRSLSKRIGTIVNDSIEDPNFGINGTFAVEGPDDVVRCREQDQMFSLIFTVTVCVYGIPSILVGFCLDLLGLRVTRLFASTMVTLGFALLSFGTRENSWLVFAGMVAIGTGANPVRLCSLQYANLWPAQRSTILFCYTSAHSLSTLVFLIFQNLHSFGVPFQGIILAAAIIGGCTFISTFIMPCMKTEHKEPDVKKDTEFSVLNGKKEDDPLTPDKEIPKNEEKPAPIPVLQSIMTISYGLHLYWLICLFTLRYYTASFNAWAYETTSDSTKIAFYNQIMGICNLASPFFSPLAGILTDFLVKRAASSDGDKIERTAKTFQAPGITLMLATVFILAVYVCKLFNTPEAVYISLVIVAMSRPLIIGSMFSYVRIRFFPDHFNRLTGISFTFVSILSSMQYFLFKWQFSSEGSFIFVGIMLIILILTSFVSPIHLFIKPVTRKFAGDLLRMKKEL